MSEAARPKGDLASLQAGRGLAALAVVLHHSAQATDGFSPSSLNPLFAWGAFGVDFFFVLSGFIIHYVHGRDHKGLASARAFARKRLLRIYAPYLPVGLAMMALYLVLPGLSAAERDWGLLTSLLLVPTSHPPALSVAWTLVYEMLFYGVFFVAYYLTRSFRVIVALWVAATVALNLAGDVERLGPLGEHVFNLLTLEFVMGMAAARWVRRPDPGPWPFWCALGLAGIGAVFGLGLTTGFGRALLGMSFMALVIALVVRERGGARRPGSPRPGRRPIPSTWSTTPSLPWPPGWPAPSTLQPSLLRPASPPGWLVGSRITSLSRGRSFEPAGGSWGWGRGPQLRQAVTRPPPRSLAERP